MAGNKERKRFSTTNRAFLTVFYDGRLKLASPDYMWKIDTVDRHNALGEYIRVVPDKPMSGSGGVELGEQIVLEPERDREVAATVVCSNGNFVEFEHGGAITVGNDGRDIEKTLNAHRESTGGEFVVWFSGTNAPMFRREGDHYVEFEQTKAVPLTMYPDEIEIKEGRIRRDHS